MRFLRIMPLMVIVFAGFTLPSFAEEDGVPQEEAAQPADSGDTHDDGGAHDDSEGSGDEDEEE